MHGGETPHYFFTTDFHQRYSWLTNNRNYMKTPELELIDTFINMNLFQKHTESFKWIHRIEIGNTLQIRHDVSTRISRNI